MVTLAVLAVVFLARGGDGKGRKLYTLRTGDVVRAPLASTLCEASAEGGAPDLFCTRTPSSRYQVIFYEDEVLIYRSGDPDNPRAVPWKP